jgi:hypothetical protein
MFYNEILEALHNKKIRYLIVGGLAVNLHNVPRMTSDIDIILPADDPAIISFIEVMNNLSYAPRLPVPAKDLADPEQRKDWITNKNMKAFSFCHTHENFRVIDLLLVHPLDFEQAWTNKCVRFSGDTPLYYVSIDDLIAMKKSAGRKIDFDDIEMLMAARSIMDKNNEPR